MTETMTGDDDEQPENTKPDNSQGVPDGTRCIGPDGKKYVHNNEQNEAAKEEMSRKDAHDGTTIDPR